VRIVSGAALVLLAGCAASGHSYRPNRDLDTERFDVACTGDFDQAPRLVAGKSPVFPIRMLNPDVVEDRKIRHLPMEWPVTTSFGVDAEGRTTDVRSTASDPPSFGNHMTVAVKQWRFQPATRDGAAMPSRCSVLFRFTLG
jgi:TonB family protein